MLVQIPTRTTTYVNPEGDIGRDRITHGTISSLIFAANLPTLVPPYFCTIQVADGSLLFWCQFGGVAGDGVSGNEEVEEEGIRGEAKGEASDILLQKSQGEVKSLRVRVSLMIGGLT